MGRREVGKEERREGRRKRERERERGEREEYVSFLL